MKIKVLLSASLIGATLFASAQNAGKTYAVTGRDKNLFYWADIKEVDIASGKVVKTLFEADKTPYSLVDLDKSAVNQRQVSNPTGLGVAALALDSRHNRLYFAPMHFSEIRYMDLDKSTANFTTIKRNIIPIQGNETVQSEENQLTRMTFGVDGNGYALTNDGNHLFRFTTGKSPVVEDLGNIIDAESNKGISIHNKCTSWGGDMVADAFGNLVVVTASHNVFTINPKSRIATYSGNITGLPANYPTNGTAVDNAGNLVVASANVLDNLYKINMKDLVATKVESKDTPFNASDWANGNFLYQKEADDAVKFSSLKPITSLSADAKVFPNPVTASQFNVVLDGQAAGTYSIVLTDLAGRTLQTKTVNVIKGSQTENVQLSRKAAPGLYLVKVINEAKQVILSEKVVVE